MKINKKLSAAITLSLMLGMYGSASAANLYGTSLARDDSSISTAEVTRHSSGVTKD